MQVSTIFRIRVFEVVVFAAVAVVNMSPAFGDSSLTQTTLTPIGSTEYGPIPPITIPTHGTLDWAIAGLDRKSGGTGILTVGGGNNTTLVSSIPGGIGLDCCRGYYPTFYYSDGALPESSGSRSYYQYDNPAVDINLPIGNGTITAWIANGAVADPVYEATLSGGVSIGPTSFYTAGGTAYMLQLSYSIDTPQTLRLAISHSDLGDPEAYNVGFFAIALGKVCEYKLLGDLNNDCTVDFLDFAIMAENWLVDCYITPENPACVPNGAP